MSEFALDYVYYEQSNGDDLEWSPDYSDLEDQSIIEPFLEEMESRASNWCLRKELSFEDMLRKDVLLGTVEAIISITGDDEIQTTNCQILPPLHFVAGEILSDIKLSEKDTGISDRKGNYTEGWIILPPNREASFDSVNRRHLNDGVGLVLDIPKLKQASAVRKQSTLEEDLESKFKDLYKFSDWVDPIWMTYDITQMTLVLATVIFDLRDSRVFPFLYGSEGGCGGKPPWDNIDTMLSALHFFRNGKSKEGILGIMDETTLIQKGKLKPKDSIFIQASHYVQTGNSAVLKLHEAKERLKGLSKSEQINLLDICKGEDPLPQGLLDKSITIEPENKLIGSCISELRKNGLVMTELDVRLKKLSSEKFSALLGKRNMGEIKLEQELKKDNLKKLGITILSNLTSSTNIVEERDARKIASAYYQTRAKRDDITGLSYAGIIRVFKTTDVLEEYYTQSGSLSDDIITSLSSYLSTDRFLHHTKMTRDYQINWLEDHDLLHLITQELPPGFGPDDARIARKLLELERVNEQPFILFVVTEDRAMIESLEAIKSVKRNTAIVRFPRDLYIKECFRKPKTHDSVDIPMINRPGRKIPSTFAARELRKRNMNKFIVLFDFPNIERSVESYVEIGSGYNRQIGGYLKRKTLKNKVSWSETPWDSLKEFEDFKTQSQTKIIFG